MSKHKDASEPKEDMTYQLGLDLLGDQSSLGNVPFDSEACRSCQACGLAREARTRVVIGCGNNSADILLIGEAPGEMEDKSGKPFVGLSGKYLRGLMAIAGLEAEHDCFITNIVKCRPPKNRNPDAKEAAACRHWLDSEIHTVGPQVIITAGAISTGFLLGKSVRITKLRGCWQSYKGIPVMPILHPAYLLRKRIQGKPSVFDNQTVEDLQKARELALNPTNR